MPKTDPRRAELAKIVAARLRELRARRNLTQDQVAQAIGCHESAVSRWESGSRLPPCQDILALADLFRVSCDELLGRREQYLMVSSALVDQALLDRLAAAQTTEEFDSIVASRGEQAIWVPLEDGAVVVSVAEAMRRTKEIANRFPDSRFRDRLFRPGA